MADFTHLHVHTQYSILDGASDIDALINKAKDDKMEAVAITDHGNMFGAKIFHDKVTKAGIKPILGCEAYVARNKRESQSEKEDRGGYHLVLLAKNENGYKNLMKMVSYSWIDGFYYKPRIDKELLREYKQDVIVSSACIGGEVAQHIMHGDIAKAEEAAQEYKDIFGDDYYLEIQRHQTTNPSADQNTFVKQTQVNEKIIEIAQKLDIKVIATNDVHFVNANDADAHDRLICINTGTEVDEPNRLRYTKEEYLKTQNEMLEVFSDMPEVCTNTKEIVDKIEEFKIKKDPIMPDFPLPEDFTDDDDYLKHITFEGAKERYGDLTDDITERLDFELATIKNMGFPGYFLIVWDFLKAARDMGVSVGPGRGSAAGSVVAYSLQITDIDPIKYDLLFERFLNPDRVSMPDIDIDFDEDGRERVFKWVVDKYGKDKVAHIVTFGTMAAKMAIRDVARVQKLPLQDADRLAKLIPDGPGWTIKKAYKEAPELLNERENGTPLVKETLQYAETLEGSIRQTGVHACGIIIGKEALDNYIPLSTAKGAELFVTQFDGRHVEDVGMLKMDFLGLKTLSIIKDAVENVKLSKDIDIDISAVELDDETTFELYSKGETTGLFQFESPGMKKHLKALKPNRFDDLIAMNALYRPGPMEYIPDFINRKHGKEKIEYDLPEMEEYLKETYGITVYQEQVMLLSQKLASFTKGQADSLRKAMGKKIKAMMDDLKGKFVEGCEKNGHDLKKVEKIWTDWEAFAQYAFNKSHSTCYAYISYQTAYLKAHHPAEFMAAVLSRNINDIKKVSIFMDECKRMAIDVKGPDVNESYLKFVVNTKGAVRFGLGAVKGVGEAAVLNIVEERKNGPFTDIYSFVERVNLASVNKRTLEALAMAGGFDEFGLKRSCYFEKDTDGSTFIEQLIRYGNKLQSENGAAPTLFGESNAVEVVKPAIPDCQDWNSLTQLNKEKDLVGIYLSAHPLDSFKLEIDSFCNTTFAQMQDLKAIYQKDVTCAGIVTDIYSGTGKTGKPYGFLTVEDYSDTYRFAFFGSDYVDYSKYFVKGYSLMIRGRSQPRRYSKDEDELEFKINSIEMLVEARETKVKSIAIKIPISKINKNTIEETVKLVDSNKGNALLKFYVFDAEKNISVQLFSRTHKVHVSDQLINYLEKNMEFEYKIN